MKAQMRIWGESTRRKLAQRALERQLAYQQRKAEHVRGHEEEIIAAMKRSSRRVRELLETFQPIETDARVIEVGSGAHGLIFYFGSQHGVGVDPLAVSYRKPVSALAKLRADSRGGGRVAAVCRSEFRCRALR